MEDTCRRTPEVAYHEAHILLEGLAEEKLYGTPEDHLQCMPKIPLLLIDDLGLGRLATAAAADVLECGPKSYRMLWKVKPIPEPPAPPTARDPHH